MDQIKLGQERRNLINEVNKEITSITLKRHVEMRKELESQIRRIRLQDRFPFLFNQRPISEDERNLITEVNHEIMSITPESYQKMREELEYNMQRVEREYQEEQSSQSLSKCTREKYGPFGLLPPFGI
jgi:hypothetical protein